MHCDRRPTDRIEASEALDTGSIPVGRTTRFKLYIYIYIYVGGCSVGCAVGAALNEMHD